MTEIKLHIFCYKRYTDDRRNYSSSQRNVTFSSASQTTPSGFNFESSYFICLEELSEKNHACHIITQEKIGLDVREWKTRNDDLAKEIIERIEKVFDLVTIGANYYDHCGKKLGLRYAGVSENEKKLKERHRSDTIETSMQDVSTFLQNNSEEC